MAQLHCFASVDISRQDAQAIKSYRLLNCEARKLQCGGIGIHTGGLPENRIAANIDRTGNTLTASLPLLVNDMIHRGDLRPGHRVLMSAFGAGLSWGSTVITWPDIAVDAIV